MRLSDRLASLPSPPSVPGARAALSRALRETGRKLVVIDDDPTGTQTVHGVRVYLRWSPETLFDALRDRRSLFYLSTNSRSLPPAEAEALGAELGRALSEAAARARVDFVVASRSDSTLRGHFPGEVVSLASGLGAPVDGILIVPAFFEAGRYTIDDIHWVAGAIRPAAPGAPASPADAADELVPAADSEFARDPDFGFRHSNLREWVEEKSDGRWRADEVRSISLELIRSGGVEAVARELASLRGGLPIVVNAACDEDLEVLALGVEEAERSGRRFIYRCAASFVKVRGGIAERPLLSREEVSPIEGGGPPGLIVAGSYVAKSSRQIERLLDAGSGGEGRLGSVAGLEIRVASLLDDRLRPREIDRAAREADRLLGRGVTPLIYTSRGVERSADFLAAGRTIMRGLCAVVARIERRPSYLVGKGGITSIELARTALQAGSAEVLGQIAAGVPVWRLGPEARWPNLPYVVFPGNVGGEDTLLRVVEILQSSDRR